MYWHLQITHGSKYRILLKWLTQVLLHIQILRISFIEFYMIILLYINETVINFTRKYGDL